jgi:hypothetical protein
MEVSLLQLQRWQQSGENVKKQSALISSLARASAGAGMRYKSVVLALHPS